ncbi:MAG: hypothetical protein COX57_12400 [Alphaproteobacteria bacterium CG_4_10_14_0_2_um_filter_63_37]|nr:MAG: hypothetical protein AUJ55_09890 [Proteobacteria bacterium CG1_02_64_396]PJA23770.1 MAG: hypothetical protein COX57_12400 [Alphaproteobacteria bacterium CG_4_10_14_0_2_um_filter_63_37]
MNVARRQHLVTLALLLCWLGAPPAYAQLYKWVDAGGVTRFGDTPPPAGTSFESRAISQGLVVEIYTTDWCHWCKKAKAFFAAQHVIVHEYDVEKDPAADRRRMALIGKREIPVVVIDGQVPIVGFNEEKYTLGLEAWRQAHPAR